MRLEKSAIWPILSCPLYQLVTGTLCLLDIYVVTQPISNHTDTRQLFLTQSIICQSVVGQSSLDNILGFFEQLAYQMGASLSEKQHFFITKIFCQINTRSKTSDRKKPIYDFQSQFSMSKIIRIFLKFYFIEEYQFRGTFFVCY